MQKLSKSDYLEKAKEYAISKGGLCLSDEYVNAKTKMEFKCGDERHSSWMADYDHVINGGRWCRQCGYDRDELKDGYNELMKYAKSRGGFVIVPSNTVIKVSTKLTWKCSNHEHNSWISDVRTIFKNKGWCPYCAGKFSKEDYLQKAKDYAIKKGGVCLSNKYENQNTKLEFKCSEHNHKKFTSVFDRLVPVDKWCKECKPNLPTEVQKRNKYLQQAKKHAVSKGGQCLSNQYINSNSKLEWKCSEQSHKIWKSTYQNTVGGLNRWCPECAGHYSPEEWIEKAKQYAKNKGGQCLTTEYSSFNAKLSWKCRESSHQPWEATISNVMKVKNSTWCPECGNSIYYKENNTRIILENLLGFKLRKAKPSWNVNSKTNYALELDGYNEENKFAFEFQGRHHFEDNVYKNTSLEETQRKDQLKVKNCLENNVYLLIINDKKHIGSLTDHINYVIDILKEKHIKFNNFDMSILIKEIESINRISEKDEYLKKAHDYAKIRNGKCLSNVYINSVTHLEWKCDNEYHSSWFAIPYISKSRSWCPQCAGKNPK